MKWLFFILTIVCCNLAVAQVVNYPAFDGTNTPQFSIEKVNVTSDTTYIYCMYKDEGHSSWINISKGTFLEDITDGSRYPLLKTTGLPFSPEKRYYNDSINAKIVLYFPSISATRFNLIEEENSVHAFNIYGIDLRRKHAPTTYSYKDIELLFKKSKEKEEQKDYQSAIYYKLKQLEAAKSVCGELSIYSSGAMYDLTLNYYYTKEYEKMIEWGKKAIDILNILPKDSATLDILARAYGNVSTAYHLRNEHESAMQYQELSLAVRRMGEGLGTISFESYLQDMAIHNYHECNYPKALLYGKEVVDVYKKKYERNKFKYGCVYVNSLSNLCEFYQRMDKFEEAVKIGKQALFLIENGACQDGVNSSHRQLNHIYTNLAGAMATLGYVDEAIRHLEYVVSNNTGGKDNMSSKMLLADILLCEKQDTLRALKEYDSILKVLSDSIAHNRGYYPSYIELLHKMYRYYKGVDSDVAIQYLNRHIQAIEEYNGEESIAFANACISFLNDIAFFSKSLTGEASDKAKLFYYLRKSSEIFKRHICNSVYNMSRNERSQYWQRFKNIYTWFIPTVCGLMKGANEANTLAYDAAIFYKGMLLSAEKDFKDVILSSNDSDLTKLFNNYVSNMSFLEKEYAQMPSSILIDSLNAIIQDEEYLLSQKVTSFNKKYKGTDYSWKDVKDHLNEEDVAIEIISYPSITGSTIYYDAYVINNKSTTPQLIHLGELENCLIDHKIDSCRLSMMIWGNKELNEKLKDAKNIYISASGILHTIGIEYLPIADGQYIFDKYNIYRLSSTRELCYINSHKKALKACLYGGLDYNRINQRIEDTNDNYEQPNRFSRSVVDSVIRRGGFDPLYGSKQEIDQVKYELAKNNILCSIYTDSDGTEESFKSMSGSQMNIIHFSTHGMYVSNEDDQINNGNNFQFVLSDDASNIDEETKSLSRSFLVMSGGNLLISRDSVPNGKEDGILTALEISHLDFNDLDLVVLSACQTALGDIHSEGVFGLQRAFKKAGANTVLMSLDKVDDEATQILMVDFYKNLMAGKSKLQSLKDAQRHLRKVENGKYDKPEYWASFIMLDGLN